MAAAPSSGHLFADSTTNTQAIANKGLPHAELLSPLAFITITSRNLIALSGVGQCSSQTMHCRWRHRGQALVDVGPPYDHRLLGRLVQAADGTGGGIDRTGCSYSQYPRRMDQS